MESTGIIWRDTARPLRFFIFDARVLGGMVIWALHMSMFTFYLALGSMCIFSALEFFGVTPVCAIRYVKNFWAGEMRLAHNRFDIRRRCQW